MACHGKMVAYTHTCADTCLFQITLDIRIKFFEYLGGGVGMWGRAPWPPTAQILLKAWRCCWRQPYPFPLKLTPFCHDVLY